MCGNASDFYVFVVSMLTPRVSSYFIQRTWPGKRGAIYWDPFKNQRMYICLVAEDVEWRSDRTSRHKDKGGVKNRTLVNTSDWDSRNKSHRAGV